MVWVALALGVTVLLLFALPSYRQGEASIAGKTADDFSMTMDGKPQKLSDYRGKVVMLNFWASWCPPCVEEAPSLNRLQRHIEGNGGTVLGFSIDEDPAAYEKFRRDFAINFPTYRDVTVKENKSQVMNGYGTTLIPESYVIDRNGKILRKIVGPQNWDSPEMLAYFDAVLKDR
jgi:cytochrome c biogenesis protein CcmG/thiol:disulfide interchange protein DsbE